MTGERWLYPGVHAVHPAMADALRGICRPGDLFGRITPARHNEGGFAAESPYTSWTVSRATAVTFANRLGPGGVMLIAETGASPDPAIWHWHTQMDDEWSELEVLLWGVRERLKVVVL